MRVRQADLPVLLRFVGVGLANAALYFALCYALQSWQGWTAFAATVTAYTCCFGVAYVAQRSLTFRSALKHQVTLPRYASLHACLALLTSTTTASASWLLTTDPLFTAIAGTLLAGAASFLISLNWVFAIKVPR